MKVTTKLALSTLAAAIAGISLTASMIYFRIGHWPGVFLIWATVSCLIGLAIRGHSERYACVFNLSSLFSLLLYSILYQGFTPERAHFYPAILTMIFGFGAIAVAAASLAGVVSKWVSKRLKRDVW